MSQHKPTCSVATAHACACVVLSCTSTGLHGPCFHQLGDMQCERIPLYVLARTGVNDCRRCCQCHNSMSGLSCLCAKCSHMHGPKQLSWRVVPCFMHVLSRHDLLDTWCLQPGVVSIRQGLNPRPDILIRHHLCLQPASRHERCSRRLQAAAFGASGIAARVASPG